MVKITRSKYLVAAQRSCHKEHVKYESLISYSSKVMANVKVFQTKVKGHGQGHMIKIFGTNRKALSQGTQLKYESPISYSAIVMTNDKVFQM